MKSPETAKRLLSILNELDMKPQELADKSGVNKSSISQYINGSHAPSNLSSGKMADVLGVNPLWLMGFDVPMTEKPEDKATSPSFTLSELEKQIIIAYRKADEFDQTTVLRTLHIDEADKKESTMAG